MAEAGIVAQYYTNEMNKVAIIDEDASSSNPIKLTPNHLQGAFMLYGFVLATGILTFCIEQCTGYKQKRKERKDQIVEELK